jgi:hypothetical protein
VGLRVRRTWRSKGDRLPPFLIPPKPGGVRLEPVAEATLGGCPLAGEEVGREGAEFVARQKSVAQKETGEPRTGREDAVRRGDEAGVTADGVSYAGHEVGEAEGLRPARSSTTLPSLSPSSAAMRGARRTCPTRPLAGSCDLGITRATHLLAAFPRAGSSLLARTGEGQLAHGASEPPCGTLSPAKMPICRNFSMGREGFEPSTLGLRVPCSTN